MSNQSKNHPPVEEYPVCLHESKPMIDMTMSAHTQFLEQLNVLLGVLKDKGFPQNLAEVKEIIHTNDLGHTLKLRELKKSEVKIGTLVLDMDQMTKFVHLPDMSPAPALLKSLQIRWNRNEYIEGFVEANYILTESGKVEIAPGLETKIREQWSVYAVTKKQIDLFKRLKGITQAYNQLVDDFGLFDPNQVPYLTIDRLLIHNIPEGTYYPDHAFIIRNVR